MKLNRQKLLNELWNCFPRWVLFPQTRENLFVQSLTKDGQKALGVISTKQAPSWLGAMGVGLRNARAFMHQTQWSDKRRTCRTSFHLDAWLSGEARNSYIRHNWPKVLLSVGSREIAYISRWIFAEMSSQLQSHETRRDEQQNNQNAHSN